MIDGYSEYSQENSPRAVESYIPPLSPDSVMEDQTPAQADDVDLVEAPAKGKRGNVKKIIIFCMEGRRGVSFDQLLAKTARSI